MRPSQFIRPTRALAVIGVAWAALGVATSAAPVQTPTPVPQVSVAGGEQTYIVFFRSRMVGQETVTVLQEPRGWTIRGANRLGVPLNVITRAAEIRYTREWQPISLLIDGRAGEEDTAIKTTFAAGYASTELTVAGTRSTIRQAVAADTLILSNGFFGSYAALAQRLQGANAGTELRAFVPPQSEVAVRVVEQRSERIETPRDTIAVTRSRLLLTTSAGDVEVNIWADDAGALLRINIPSQFLDIARQDVASAATRMTPFTVAGDETVRIPAAGFGLGATITTPSGMTPSSGASEPAPRSASAPASASAHRWPAVILVGGSTNPDRDGFVDGVPVLGHVARDLAAAGFVVVRFDRRGSGQSGGRSETSTIADGAEDVRAILRWLEDERKDVDKERMAVVGYDEGGWIAMTVAAREKRVAALVLVGTAASVGSELVLQQQRAMLERLASPEAEQHAKIALQQRINAAVLQGKGWEGVPDEVRRAADTPWFQSFLAFDPARVMRDVRQPVLIVHGARDPDVPAAQADRLVELARARTRKVAADVTTLPGLDHRLVTVETSAPDGAAAAPPPQVSPAATQAIADWLKRLLK